MAHSKLRQLGQFVIRERPPGAVVDPIDDDAILPIVYMENNAMRIIDEMTDLHRGELFAFGY